MDNLQKSNTNCTPISKNESYIVNLVRSADLLTFGAKEIKALSGWKKTRIHNTFSSLVKKGLIIRIKQDTYTLEETFFDKTFEVITDAFPPSYISFWTALSYYGFTEQQVNVIQLVSTKQFKNLEVKNKRIDISQFKPERFFGYKNEESIVIAEKEKALIDSLFRLEKCGGLGEYIKCIENAFETLNAERLKRYTIRFGNKSLVSRMAFLIDYLELAESDYLQEFKEHISNSYILFDPNGGSVINHDNEWKVKVNVKMEELI